MTLKISLYITNDKSYNEISSNSNVVLTLRQIQELVNKIYNFLLKTSHGFNSYNNWEFFNNRIFKYYKKNSKENFF